MGVLVAEPLRVRSDSMAPTLRAGDHVLLDKLSYRVREPHRREVIAFEAPGGGLGIKRVIAVSGDTVGIEDGVLVVNGSAVVEPFVTPELLDGTYFGPVIVPRDTVFVLGDNRANSLDSRRYGPIPVDRIEGRVLVTLWPP